jgi:glycosyltransferase involved in cell wall biosynthesis
MIHPTLSIFGLLQDDLNKFVPHYYILHRMYGKDSRLHFLESDSYINIKPALAKIDYWTLDADFIYADDTLSFNELLGYDQDSFDYFSGFLKIQRIAFSTDDPNLGLDTRAKWNSDEMHQFNIFGSMMQSDIIIVSPYAAEKMWKKPLIHDPLVSPKVGYPLIEKFLILPPPDMYKLSGYRMEKDYATLIFLWNHRLSPVKNFPVFCDIIREFRSSHPDVPVQILILDLGNSCEFMPHLNELQSITKFRAFVFNDRKYEDALFDANITINTSLYESFGISALECVKYNLVVINLHCSKTFSWLMGNGTTFHREDIVDKIYKVHKSAKYRRSLLSYNRKALQKAVITEKQWVRKFEVRMNAVLKKKLSSLVVSEVLQQRIDRTLRQLQMGSMTKRDIHKHAFKKEQPHKDWGTFYYALRKAGVGTTLKKDVLWFHYGDPFK